MKTIEFYDVEQVAPINAPAASTAKSPYAALELLDAGFAAFNADYAATVAAFEQSLAELDSLTELIAAGADLTEARELVKGAQVRLAETSKLLANVAEREEQVIAVQKSIVKSLGGAETDDFAALQQGFAAALADKLDLAPNELELATTDAAKTTAAAIVSKALAGTEAAAAISKAASADAAAAEKAVVIKAVAKANEAASKAAAKAAKALAKAAAAEKQGDKAAAALAKAQAKAAKELVKTVEQQKKNIAKAEAKAAQEALETAKKAAEAEKAAVAEAAKKGADELKKEAAAAKTEAQKQLAEQKAAEKAAAEKAAAEAKAAEKAAAEAEQKALDEVKAAIAAGKDADAAADAAKPVDAELAAAEKDAASKAETGSAIVNPELDKALDEAMTKPTEPETKPSTPSTPSTPAEVLKLGDDTVNGADKLSDLLAEKTGTLELTSSTAGKLGTLTKTENDWKWESVIAGDKKIEISKIKTDTATIAALKAASGAGAKLSDISAIADATTAKIGATTITLATKVAGDLTFSDASTAGAIAAIGATPKTSDLQAAKVAKIGEHTFDAAKGVLTLNSTAEKITFKADVTITPATIKDWSKTTTIANIASVASKVGNVELTKTDGSAGKLGATALEFSATATVENVAKLTATSAVSDLKTAGVNKIAGNTFTAGSSENASTLTVGEAVLTVADTAKLGDLAGLSGSKTLADLQAAGASAVKVGSAGSDQTLDGASITVEVKDTKYQAAPQTKLSDFIELAKATESFDHTGKPGISKEVAAIDVGSGAGKTEGTTKLSALGDKLQNGDVATVKADDAAKGTLAKDGAGKLTWLPADGKAIAGVSDAATLSELVAVSKDATWTDVKKILPAAAVKIDGKELGYEGDAHKIEGAAIAEGAKLSEVADYLAGANAGKIAALATVLGVASDGNKATLSTGELAKASGKLTWAAGADAKAVAISKLDTEATVTELKAITSADAAWTALTAVAASTATVKVGSDQTGKTVSAITTALSGITLKESASIAAVAAFAADKGDTLAKLAAIAELGGAGVTFTEGTLAAGAKTGEYKWSSAAGEIEISKLNGDATLSALKAIKDGDATWKAIKAVAATGAKIGSVSVDGDGKATVGADGKQAAVTFGEDAAASAIAALATDATKELLAAAKVSKIGAHSYADGALSIAAGGSGSDATLALKDSGTLDLAKLAAATLATSNLAELADAGVSKIGAVALAVAGGALQATLEVATGGALAVLTSSATKVSDLAAVKAPTGLSYAAGTPEAKPGTFTAKPGAADALDLSDFAATENWKFDGSTAEVTIKAPVVAAKALADFTLENWEANDKLSIGAANGSTAKLAEKTVNHDSADYKVTAEAAANSAPAVLSITKDGEAVAAESITDALIKAVAAALDGDASIAANSVYQVADSAGVYIINVGSTAKDDYTIVHLSGLGSGTLAVDENGILTASGAASVQ